MDDLTPEEVERYLNKVFTGTELFNLKDRLLVFQQPSNEVRAKADLMYDKALKKATDLGMLSISELSELIKERNLFTQAEQDRLDANYGDDLLSLFDCNP